MPRTDSGNQLAALYTAADVFFNPTVEDNYPTVNLEAEACGTPVVTYDTGGCKETVRLAESSVVSGFGIALDSLRRMVSLGQHRPNKVLRLGRVLARDPGW